MMMIIKCQFTANYCVKLLSARFIGRREWGSDFWTQSASEKRGQQLVCTHMQTSFPKCAKTLKLHPVALTH